jgi:S-(hydroxymethyl)glutathione dehydrogenase/alcohol dehydrogenase
MTIKTRAAVMVDVKNDWQVMDLELDEPKANEVLVRFEAAGMCHSDDHIRTGDYLVTYPMVGGHEGAGVVEAIGPNVDRVEVGDRIVCSFIPACGTCKQCSTGHQAVCELGLNATSGRMLDDTFRFHTDDGRDIGGFCCLGTFARRSVLPEYSCIKLDDDIPFDVGALLSCGVPTGWGSSVYAAGVQGGDTVVIYGTGGVGSNAVQGAKYAGARRIITVDPVPFKREMAKVFGATHTFATHDEAHAFVTQVTHGQMAEHAIITVGINSSETVTQALSMIGKLGQLTITAAEGADSNDVQIASVMMKVYLQRIQGTLCGHCNPLSDLPKLMELYRSGELKLDELITNRYSLDQVNDIYHDMLDGKNIRGVIIHSD